jgi:hypothetical protein
MELENAFLNRWHVEDDFHVPFYTVDRQDLQ